MSELQRPYYDPTVLERNRASRADQLMSEIDRRFDLRAYRVREVFELGACKVVVIEQRNLIERS